MPACSCIGSSVGDKDALAHGGFEDMLCLENTDVTCVHLRCERIRFCRELKRVRKALLIGAVLLMTASSAASLPWLGPFTGRSQTCRGRGAGYRRRTTRQQRTQMVVDAVPDPRGGATDDDDGGKEDDETSRGSGRRRAPFPLSFLAAFRASIDAKEEASTEGADAKTMVVGRNDRPLRKGLPYGGGGVIELDQEQEGGVSSKEDEGPNMIITEVARVDTELSPREKDKQRNRSKKKMSDEPEKESVHEAGTVASEKSEDKEVDKSGRSKKGAAKAVGKMSVDMPSAEDGTGKGREEKEKEDSTDTGTVPVAERERISRARRKDGGEKLKAEAGKSVNATKVAETETNISPSEDNTTLPLVPLEKAPVSNEHVSPYVSSGHWETIDRVTSFGMSTTNSNLRISRHLRVVRKAAASATGLHGIVSGKGRGYGNVAAGRHTPVHVNATIQFEGDHSAEKNGKGSDRDAQTSVGSTVAKAPGRAPLPRGTRVRWVAQTIFLRRRNGRNRASGPRKRPERAGKPKPLVAQGTSDASAEKEREAIRKAAFQEELRRRERVKEIDRLMGKGQAEMLELQCEKDDLQRRPNPLFNYTALPPSESGLQATSSSATLRTTRVFNFPPPALASEYIDELVSSGRLVMLNHTQLWKSRSDIDDDDDEEIGDDLLTPSADVRKLYEDVDSSSNHNSGDLVEGKKRERRNGAEGGSWLLRQSFGGKSLGEKVGEATEIAAYKAVCSAIMSVLARSISALHGLNVMTHSDIRLFVEDAPDLPPLGKSALPDGERYAEEALRKAMRKSAKRRKKRSKHHSSRSHGHDLSEEAFIQRDAVVETLISHCQISAPLLKLFPLAWQRALLGNIISLVAAVVSDFAEGIKIQILGHQLSFSFKPITESDMIQHIGMGGDFRFNHRRAKPEEFEAAVRATAQDVSDSLEFLDRWHERALGSGMLRAQIGNLIARVVLTLTDEVLSGAKFDMWSAQAGGPRIVAGLEYRVENDVDAANDSDVENSGE